jgi:hypothetical protein
MEIDGLKRERKREKKKEKETDTYVDEQIRLGN